MCPFPCFWVGFLNAGDPHGTTARQGRLPSIPSSAYKQVFDLSGKGLGVHRIAAALADQGVFISRSSVDRLLRGLPAYE